MIPRPLRPLTYFFPRGIRSVLNTEHSTHIFNVGRVPCVVLGACRHGEKAFSLISLRVKSPWGHVLIACRRRLAHVTTVPPRVEPTSFSLSRHGVDNNRHRNFHPESLNIIFSAPAPLCLRHTGRFPVSMNTHAKAGGSVQPGSIRDPDLRPSP
jgi:hypothetical protein